MNSLERFWLYDFTTIDKATHNISENAKLLQVHANAITRPTQQRNVQILQ